MRSLATALVVLGTSSIVYAHPGSVWRADSASPPAAADLAPAAMPQQTNQLQSIFILVLSGAEVAAPAALDDAARQEIEANTALQLAPRDSFSQDLRRNTIASCAGDAACFSRALSKAGVNVDLLLTISATNIGEDEGALLGLRLVDTDKGGNPPQPKDIATYGEEIPAGASPVRAVKDQVKNVFPPTIWGQVASLTVNVDQENAEVLVGNLPQCVSPCKIERMLPGKYPVVVKKAGYVDWVGSHTLSAGATEVLPVTLTKEDTPLTSSPWFWGAIGLGVVAAGTAAVVLATGNDGPITICIARDISLCE